MQQSYNQQNDVFYVSNLIIQPGINEQRNYEQNNREHQYGMNPWDLKGPLPGILRKMSPKGNVEGYSDSGYEKMENVNQIRYFKTQLDNNMMELILR